MSEPLVCTLTITALEDGTGHAQVALGRPDDDNVVLVARRTMPSYPAAIVVGTELAQRTLRIFRTEAMTRLGDDCAGAIPIPICDGPPPPGATEAGKQALQMFMTEAHICVAQHGGNAALTGLLSAFVNTALSAGANLDECARNLRTVADRLPEIRDTWALANTPAANAGQPT